MKKKNILIIGGTSTIAERCARVWSSQQPCHLVLVGRDNNKLKRVSADIQFRYPTTSVDIKTINFLKVQEIEGFVEEIMKEFMIDIALIAHGSLPIREDFKPGLINYQKSLEINGVFLPDNMSIEFQKQNTDRPRIVVFEQKPGSKFKMRVFYLQLVMMAGR